MPAPAASSPPPRTHAERRAMLATMRTDTLPSLALTLLTNAIRDAAATIRAG